MGAKEAFKHGVEAKEVYREGVEIKEAAWNCLVSVAASAFRKLSGGKELDAWLLRDLLPETNENYLRLVMGVFEKETGVRFVLQYVDREGSQLRRCLMKFLDEGRLCMLAIKGPEWVMKTRGKFLLKNWTDMHAVLIFGYYAPEGKRKEMWLYLGDSYTERLWFLPFEEVMRLLENELEVPVGSFKWVGREGRGLSWRERSLYWLFDRKNLKWVEQQRREVGRSIIAEKK